MRIRAPLRQARLLQVRCRRVDATSTTSWWIAAHPQVFAQCSSRATPIRSTEVVFPAEALIIRHPKPGQSHRLFLAMLCSSKGSDGRSEAMNATLLRLQAIARLISCRVTPCHPPSASRTAGRGRSGAVNGPSFTFRHGP